jgi:hypothetical protein
MLKCASPLKSGFDKLPCEVSQPIVSATFKDVNVTIFDRGIYTPTTIISTTIRCALLCFSRDCLAFILVPKSFCWQHVTRFVCRKRKGATYVPEGSRVMVRKVRIQMNIFSLVIKEGLMARYSYSGYPASPRCFTGITIWKLVYPVHLYFCTT